ncbi:hypothetical protein AB8U03_16595 [Clostridium sp. Mt-5]|uniref:Uncharacterized protein n=1 Tax=Clostridium moutaii TaxID=3240932 RepID=A0ABV4BY52_9CLOT
MMYRLSIEEVLDKIVFKIDDMDSIVKSFIKFYLQNHRHKYSKVAKFINDKAINDEQTVYFVLSNINSIINYCKENENDINQLIDNILSKNNNYTGTINFTCIELLEKLEKLQDHIELESQRINFSQNREDRIFSNLIDQINVSVNSAQTNIESKSNKIEDRLNTTVISTLGIFSAIVVVFFSGLNAIGSIFSNMKDVNKYRLVFMASLEGFIMFNSIFLLLYCIAKILDKDIGTNKWPPENLNITYWNLQYQYDVLKENGQDSEKLEKLKKQLTIKENALNKYRHARDCGILKLITRYPTVFYTNLVLIFLMAAAIIFKYIPEINLVFLKCRELFITYL